MSVSSNAEPIVVGDNATLELLAYKNGSVWDISSGTVVLRLKKPDGTVLPLIEATITDGESGLAEYITDDELDVDGDWEIQWSVTKGGVTLSSRSVPFAVLPLNVPL